MRTANKRLELIGGLLALAAIICVVGIWTAPSNYHGVLFVLFILFGIPASMVSLHLGHPRWFFRLLERQ